MARAAKAGDWEVLDDGRARVGEAVLEPAEFDLRLQPRNRATCRALPDNTGLVVVDTVVPPELEAEGRARDLVRAVQTRRRDLGLDVSDRIGLEVVGSPSLAAVLDVHGGYVAEQTLAVTLDVRPGDGPGRGDGDRVGDGVGVGVGGGDGDGWTAVALAGDEAVWVRITKR